jgi:FkbM family methyltransferase
MGVLTIAVRLLAALTRRLCTARPDLVLRWVEGPGRHLPVETVVRLPGGPRIRVGSSNYIDAHIFFFGSYELEVAQLLRRLVPPGGCAIDVGAHIGVHALTMADAAGPEGRVLACEPNPELRPRLEANVALNGFSNVEIHPLALLDREGWIDLYLNRPDERNDGTASLSPRAAEAASRKVQARATTLDQLGASAGLDGVNVVKIDVEGFEGAVLAGGRHVLQRDLPALIFEHWEPSWQRAGEDFDRVVAALRRLGYTSFASITPRGLLPIREAPTVHKNVLATAPRAGAEDTSA